MRTPIHTQDSKGSNRSIKSWLTLTAGLLLLPIIAACAPETTQTPDAQAPTAESPAAQAPAEPDTAPGTSPDTVGQTDRGEDVASVIDNNPSLSTLASAIDAAGLQETLEGDSASYTVFAPSDEAFAALPEETRQQLLLPENRETLRQLLLYHVVPGTVTSDQIQSGEVQTVAGESVEVQVDAAANQVRVNNASVTQPDLQASNGVVHIVDQVILPPDLAL
ncbi:MAG: fasciclin domain-containing protein [Synechococcales cyanobacterium C42_A2020_086]|jgi:uncharacterized surface protein with fasciclin (FAS1) repeats|nr:fasciclin domain-containing protein [Synechococcales cyanobacterium C42_A2020_086]